MLHWSSKFVLFLRRLIRWIFKSTCFSLQQRKQSTKWKGNIQNGRKHLQTIYEIRDWYVEYINDSYNSLTENQITQLKNSQMTWKDISPKNIHKRPLSIWKDALHQPIIREMQIKATSYYYYLILYRIDTIKK